MKIGELFVALGFDVDEKKLKGFNDGIKAARNGLFALSGMAAGAVYGVNKFLSSAVSDSVALSNFAESTGYATDEIERFYNVAREANPLVNLQQTTAMMGNLSRIIAQAKLGEGPLGPAGMLGIYDLPTTSPEQLLKRLYEDYQKNTGIWGLGDRNVINELLSNLGIGPEFLPMFNLPRDEFMAAYNQPIITEDQRSAMVKMAEATSDFYRALDLLKGKLAEKYAPYFVEFLEAIPPLLENISNKVARFIEDGKEIYKAWEPLGKLFEIIGTGLKFVKDNLSVKEGSLAAKTEQSDFMKFIDNFFAYGLSGAERVMGQYNPLPTGIGSNITNNNSFYIQGNDPQTIGIQIKNYFDDLNKGTLDEQGQGAYEGVR